jgi:small subunit ribosomal protein S18
MIKRRKSQVKKVYRECAFCESKTVPDYRNYQFLEKYLTERGKIISRTRTGTCSRHQRQLTREIKRARHLSLLPFIIRG